MIVLHEFLTANRGQIIARVREKALRRSTSHSTDEEPNNGVPMFLTQLVEMLQTDPGSAAIEIGTSATKHGEEMRQKGFTIAQVVQDYGEICQAITEIAVEQKASIETVEFKTLNCCLDSAVAAAVTEFGRQQEQFMSDESNEQLGVLAHELRNALHTATLGFDALQSGLVGPGGSTSKLVLTSLGQMHDLLERSLTEVRLKAGVHRRTSVSVATLIQEVAVAAELDAAHRHLQLTIGTVAEDLMVNADKHILVSALSNLVQNAFKFTRTSGHVSLQTCATGDRVEIAIEDECGGLPVEKSELLFRLFEQQGTDRTGLGLGLAISRRGIEDSGGTIHVRDIPGKGCVFTVSLPTQQ
jgi:signal transduction histidine kinase